MQKKMHEEGIFPSYGVVSPGSPSVRGVFHIRRATWPFILHEAIDFVDGLRLLYRLSNALGTKSF